MSIFLQLWFLAASTLTWFLIERVGRRRLFMLSACCMGIVMAVVAAMLAVNTHTSGIVAVVMIFAYQAFFTWGFMGGVWVSYVGILKPFIWICITPYNLRFADAGGI